MYNQNIPPPLSFLLKILFLLWNILFLLPTQAATDCIAQTDIPEIECKALLTFYHNTNGANWINKGGWNVDNMPCSWYGITCSGGKVISLYLPDNNLDGTLPIELSNLSNLQSVELSSYSYPPLNKLKGFLPLEWSRLRTLHSLSLRLNQLSGPLPVEWSTLSALQYLDLGGNQFSGPLPVEWSSLSALQSLYLGWNQLSGPLPVGWGNLTALKQLELYNNQLGGGIPSSFTQLIQLGSNGIAVRYNMLTADPTIAAFINSYDNDWQSYQTIPPKDFKVTANQNQIQLNWTPVLYQADQGHYEIGYSLHAGGPYTIEQVSGDKTASTYTVTSLSPATPYYFVIRTYTSASVCYYICLTKTWTSPWTAEFQVTTLSSTSFPEQPPPPIEKPLLIANPPAPLTRPYGLSNPDLIVTYTGWINDVQEALGEPSTLSTSAIPASPPGIYPITCSEGQDDHYRIVCGNPSTLTVTPAPTETTLAPMTPNPSPSGSTITLKATVRPLYAITDSSVARPSGEIEVQQGTNPVCKMSLVGTEGTCTVALHGVGPQTFTAHYLGNPNFQESASEPIGHFLLQAGYASTPAPGGTLLFGSGPLHTRLTTTLVIQETGNQPLTVSLNRPIDDPDFHLMSPDLPLNIASGETATLTFSCAPTSLGLHLTTLELLTNDPHWPLVTYSLTCEGKEIANSPGYDSSPPLQSILQLGSSQIGQSVVFPLSVQEIGTADLQLDSFKLTGPQVSDFQVISPAFPITIKDKSDAPSIIEVQCTPSALGLRKATLTVNTNDPQHPAPTYPLECTGQGDLPPPEITQITLSNHIVAAHSPVDHLIGTFQALVTQPSPAFHFAYHLLYDAQGTFKVVEDQLILAKNLVFDQPEIYQIIVKSTETHTGIEKNAVFVIQVNHDNHTPTDIQLSHTQVKERTQGLVGTLTTLDPDNNDSHTYTIASGGQFILQNGHEIHVDQNITFKQLTYLVRVTSTDLGGLSVTKAFTIEVQPEPEWILEAKGESDHDFIQVKGKQGNPAIDLIKVDESERVFLRGTFYPSRFHVGQLADLMFFYEWTPPEGTQPELKGSHIFSHQERLETVIEPRQFFNYKVVGLKGTFKVGLGYQIDDQIWSEPAMLDVYVTPNHPPTNLRLDIKLEGPLTDDTPENTLIGIVSMDDLDRHEELTYQLMSWPRQLKLEKDRLLVGGLPFFDIPMLGKKTYPVTIRGWDLNRGTVEKTFELTVTNPIKGPKLTRSWINEGVPLGSLVGKLRMFGPNITYHYQLVDNAQGHFVLEGDQLLVHAPLDFEEQERYEIEVEVSFGEEKRTKKLEIEVMDVQEQ